MWVDSRTFVSFNTVAKMAQNGRKTPLTDDITRHIFLLKNAKLRLNIIAIDTLRAARVFIAFTFPQPSECAVLQNSDARESFLPYKSSAGVLLESWRSKGGMNFRKNDANRSNYVFSMFSNAFYALYNDTEVVYRCLLFLRGINGGRVPNRGQFCFFGTQSRFSSNALQP